MPSKTIQGCIIYGTTSTGIPIPSPISGGAGFCNRPLTVCQHPSRPSAKAAPLKGQILHTLLVLQSERLSPKKCRIYFSKFHRNCEKKKATFSTSANAPSLPGTQTGCLPLCLPRGIHFLCSGVNFLSALSFALGKLCILCSCKNLS